MTLNPMALALAAGVGTLVLLFPLVIPRQQPARRAANVSIRHTGRRGRHRGRRWTVAPLPLRLLEELWAPEVRVEGTSTLRTRLIHAGQGHHTPTWVRLRQACLVCLFIGLAAAGLWTETVPPVAAPLALVAAVAGGVLLPYADLIYRAGQRRERLCLELVPFLHALAALVAAGATLERALGEVASEGGELTAELAEALKVALAALAVSAPPGTLRHMPDRRDGASARA